MRSNILFTKKNAITNSNIFEHIFPTNVKLVKSELAITNIAFYNSFFNVSAALGNNLLEFFFPIRTGTNAWTQTRFSLVLKDGFYSIPSINEALQLYCIQQGLYLEDTAKNLNVYFLEISINSIEYKGQLDVFRLPTAADAAGLGWTVPTTGTNTLVLETTASSPQRPFPYFQLGALAEILGFFAGTYPPANAGPFSTAAYTTAAAHTHLSQGAPHVNRVSSLVIRCSMVSDTRSNPVDLLAQIPVSSAYGALTKFDAPFPTFAHTSEGTFSSLQLSFYDQNLRPVIFYDPEVTFTVQLRERR